MELQEFINETLSQIINGVGSAKEETKETGAVINPTGNFGGQALKFNGGGYNEMNRIVVHVKISVAIQVSEKGASKGGLSVLSGMFNAGGIVSESETNSSAHRVEFEVPVVFG